MPKSPFSNGSQYIDWCNSNCCRCDKSWNNGGAWLCDIEKALSYAAIDDGKVSDEIGKRMGFTDPLEYVWMCPEVEWTAEWIKEKTERDHQEKLF